MAKDLFNLLEKEIDNLHAAGLFHDEYQTDEVKKANVNIKNNTYIDMTSHDFLGLKEDQEIKDAAIKAIEQYGVGAGSTRFIAGTSGLHQQLETEIAQFLKKDTAAVYCSLYQANEGILESLVNHQDYVFAHSHCHASIIDGIQLSKAKKHYWNFSDLSDLEDQLKRSPRARFRFIFTEGILSNDGRLVELEKLCDLADKYDALVILHDTNAIGVIGESGRGSAWECKVLERVHIVTGGFNKAMSGIELGFVAANKQLIRWLKQKSKPYVFSVSPSPCLVAAAICTLNKVKASDSIRASLIKKVGHFRSELNKIGFRLIKSDAPMVNILTNDAVKTQKMIDQIFNEKVFVLGLCYPVVPKGFARICCNITVHHTYDQLDVVVKAVHTAGKKQKLVK